MSDSVIDQVLRLERVRFPEEKAASQTLEFYGEIGGIIRKYILIVTDNGDEQFVDLLSSSSICLSTEQATTFSSGEWVELDVRRTEVTVRMTLDVPHDLVNKSITELKFVSISSLVVSVIVEFDDFALYTLKVVISAPA